jgi:hypothetical protein
MMHTKKRIVVFSYIYDSQRVITRFILRYTGNKSYRDSMRFLSKNDNRTEQIDKGLKNRWRWAWLNEKNNQGREWRD